MANLPPQYDPKGVEKKCYENWEQLGVFQPESAPKDKSFCVIQPPPNVTGVLHMGHALTSTIEDIMVRRKRMQGFATLWLPGTDHAGIATQMVVERQLLEQEGKTKHDVGREEFLKRVWKWKEHSQSTILSQQRKIGASLDWSRLAFTLDEGPARAVRECFFRLHQEGLVYREQAMIQWCPRCRTALSDLEVKFETKKSHLWSIRYRLKDDPKKFLIVATTRPETLLADTAVAVHPEDERYKEFQGKTVLLPLLDREIPVIADDYVDREFGTGALKITPGHDPNDYEIGKKHKLPVLTMLDETAALNEVAGPYQGLSREEGRKKIVADLVEKDLLEGEEDYSHNVGQCDRCKTTVEPRVSSQWFVNAKELAKEAIRVVEDGEIKLVPQDWENTYFEWMRNIRPWCVSRQLWWGHRIPVWYCGDCQEVTVAVKDPTACSSCGSKKLKQDEDVLDTWFSSGLWPFSTLGWPSADGKPTEDLKQFYPTDVMETGFDILFFWVARMIMLGIRMTGQIPFHTVYLHPMVRDEYGQKMSKTKGNVVDPLEIIDDMGADSLRMHFARSAYHGRDVRVSDAALQSSRNFVNKLWNASRFTLMHYEGCQKSQRDLSHPVTAWIWDRFNRAAKEVNEALDQYRFYEAASVLYHFTWDTFCSQYIELIKIPSELEASKKAAESTAVEVLERLVALLHPMMPFVTEEIWAHLPLKESAEALALRSYPQFDESLCFPDQASRIDDVLAIAEAVRTQRGMANMSPAEDVPVTVVAEKSLIESLKPLSHYVESLAKARPLSWSAEIDDRNSYVMRAARAGIQVFIAKEHLGDWEAQLEKLRKEAASLEQARQRAEGKLKNKKFVDGAPPEVVQGVKDQLDSLGTKLADIRSYLEEN